MKRERKGRKIKREREKEIHRYGVREKAKKEREWERKIKKERELERNR